MAKKSKEEKLRGGVLRAHRSLDDKLATYRDYVARSRIPSIEKEIIEIKKKHPADANIHFLQNSFDKLKLDVGVTETKEQGNKLGLHAECLDYNEKALKNFESLYRAVKRIEKNIELSKQDMNYNKE